MFVIGMSSFFLPSLCSQQLDKPQEEEKQQLPQPLSALAFLYPHKSPQNSKRKHTSAGRVTPLGEHETNPSQLPWTV